MLNLPLLALGAVGVVSVVGHLVGPRLAELIAAVESGDLVEGAGGQRGLLPVYTGIFRTQGVDPDQGRAAASCACPPARCARRWSTPPPSRSRSCASDLAAGGISL